MVYEIVVQHVDPAKRDEHIAGWREAWKQANFAGSHEVKFLRSVEDPGGVIVQIEWDSVEAHQRHRGTPVHNAFREAAGGFQTAPSEVSHYTFEVL
jgi:quinol monooxygenase YgiN